MFKDKEIFISELEAIALEMETSIDKLMETIQKHEKMMCENAKRHDVFELSDEMRKNEIFNRVQTKINELRNSL